MPLRDQKGKQGTSSGTGAGPEHEEVDAKKREGGYKIHGGEKYRIWSLVECSGDSRRDGLVTLLTSPTVLKDWSWEPIRKAGSWAPPRPIDSETLGRGLAVYAFTVLQVTPLTSEKI